MKKRVFLNQALLTPVVVKVVAGLAAASPLSALSQRVLQPGRNYRKLASPRRTHADVGKIEVIEFFWVGCPHCRAIDPTILQWEKQMPADVIFRKVHVNFRVPTHQRLYYTLETLKLADAMTPAVFAEIHDRRNRLQTDQLVFDWAERQGIERASFMETYKSFGVSTRMKRASQQVSEYAVDGVPTLAVNGKYVTSPSMAGSNASAMQVVDALISL
ncbi:MAG: thiol:disulfide interchange protein DsbA/DsbL, partial [Burkholderiaceae bacterium]